METKSGVKKEKSIFHKNGKLFWSSNVLTNVLYNIEPRDLIVGRYMEVSKNFKKATNAVITVWRYEGTNMIEKNLDNIEKAR